MLLDLLALLFKCRSGIEPLDEGLMLLVYEATMSDSLFDVFRNFCDLHVFYGVVGHEEFDIKVFINRVGFHICKPLFDSRGDGIVIQVGMLLQRLLNFFQELIDFTVFAQLVRESIPERLGPNHLLPLKLLKLQLSLLNIFLLV